MKAEVRDALTTYDVWKGIPGIRNLDKRQCGIGETLTRYGICHILSTDAVLEKNDIRNKLTSRPNDGGSSGCGIPVKNKRGCGNERQDTLKKLKMIMTKMTTIITMVVKVMIMKMMMAVRIVVVMVIKVVEVKMRITMITLVTMIL